MRYERVPPSSPLKGIVESVWIQEDPTATGHAEPSCVVPTGTVELLFHYGAPFAHVDGPEQRLQPMSYVTGPRTRPVLARATGSIGIVIVSLYPWGLSRLFPEALHAVDAFAGLRSLADASSVDALEEQLRVAAGAAERVRCVEAFLLAHLSRMAADARGMAAACMLAETGTEDPVWKVARRLQVSRRHLTRMFSNEVGISPKTFSRIMRFQQAMRMRRSSRASWATIAATCGYADQAHLIRDVREFAGRTPQACSFDEAPPAALFNGAGASRFFDTVYVPGNSF